MSATPLRVLCLDIEGGFGGSSRSLYESLRSMDRNKIAPEVWCRRDGPIRARYEALGIPCRIVSGMPTMNSLQYASRNLYGYAVLLWRFLFWGKERFELVNALRQRFDLVHFNHEGLFCLADWLRGRHNKAQVTHVRTMIFDNIFGRWQSRRLMWANDRLVFITENERDNVEMLGSRAANSTVIYNIAEPPPAALAAPAAIPNDSRLKIAVLSNYAFIRGVDRIVEIAQVLAARNRRDLLFVIAGDMKLTGSLPEELGEIARAGGTLADYAVARGVADMMLFLGHVAEPEAVLTACDVLLKPTRDNNPWGRDILEALAAGKPVVSVGRYSRFVETEKTGVLLEHYSADAVAKILLSLDADRDHCLRLGANAAQRAAKLCNGAARASDLLAVWQEAIARRSMEMTT